MFLIFWNVHGVYWGALFKWLSDDFNIVIYELYLFLQDEGSFQMKKPARELLKDMGSEKAEILAWRDMWAMVTVKAGNPFIIAV